MAQKDVRPRLARKVIDCVSRSGDDAAQRALALLLDSAARLGKPETGGLDGLIHAALRKNPIAASWWHGVAVSAATDKELARWLATAVADAFPQQEGKGGLDFDRLARDAGAKGAPPKEEANDKPGKKDDATVPTQERPRQRIEVDAGDGIKVTVDRPTGTPPADDAKDADVPTIYGEEIESGKALYRISIHTIECVETTDYTAVGIFTAGIAGITGVDDTLGWSVTGTARFEGGIHVPILFTSNGVHEDVSETDVLSSIADLVKPRAKRRSHRIDPDESMLVNRYMFQRPAKRNQAGVHTSYPPFDVAKFEGMEATFALFEDDSAIKETIEEILKLLQEITNLASRALAVTTGGTTEIVRTVIDELSGSNAFVRVNQLLQRLINSQDKIDHAHFLITPNQIEAAFNGGGAIQRYPANSSVPSFEYVTDLPEQIAELVGDGAHYIIKLRYERVPATN